MPVNEPAPEVKEWLEQCDTEDEQTAFQRTYFRQESDFSDAIAKTRFAIDHHLSRNDETVSSINFLLNIYKADIETDTNTRPTAENSRVLLKAAAAALSDAAQSLKNIEKDRYAASAIIAILPSLFPEIEDVDSQIDEFNRLTSETQRLSSLVAGLTTNPRWSSGLPRPSSGKPADAHFDTLLFRLSRVVRESVCRTYELSNSGASLSNNSHKTSVGSLSRHITEILSAANIVRSHRTIEKRLSAVDEYFPLKLPSSSG